jgi:uncharacterized membrane protein
MSTDPYATPAAPVADAPSPSDEVDFLPEGRVVPAGNAFQWLGRGWGLFTQQPGIWIAIVVLFAALTIVVNFVPLIGGLVALLFGPVLVGGLMMGCRGLERGEPLEIGHLFAGFRRNTGQLVLIGVVTLVAWLAILLLMFAIAGTSLAVFGMGGMGAPGQQAASGLAAGGAIFAGLLGLALAIPMYMALWFATPLVALSNLDTLSAVRRSFFGCLRNIVPFLLYALVLFLLAIVATIPIGLGWLVLGPVLIASVYAGYRDIFFAG